MKFLNVFIAVSSLASVLSQDLISPRLVITTDQPLLIGISDRVDGKGWKLVFPEVKARIHAITLSQKGWDQETEEQSNSIGPRPYGEYRIEKVLAISSWYQDKEQKVVTCYLSRKDTPTRPLKIEIRQADKVLAEWIETETASMAVDREDRLLVAVSDLEKVRKWERFLRAGMPVFIHTSLPVD